MTGSTEERRRISRLMAGVMRRFWPEVKTLNLDASGNWRRIEFCDSLTGIGVEEKDRCRGRAALGMSKTG
jgi:hypothetical protein